MAKIILETGEIVLLDDEDYDYVNNFYDLHIDKFGYVQCRIKPKYRYKKMGLFSSISLHKLLRHPEKTGRGIDVDHVNGDKLDNRKSMLRVCSHAQNARNRKVSEGFSSKYKGVGWHKNVKRWEVRIKINNKNINLGTFTNELYAANAYNYFAKKYHLDFALLNDCEFVLKEIWEKDWSKGNKSSQYRGVSINKTSGFYKVQIWDNINKKNVQLGEHQTETEAAEIYNKKALELYGEKAKLNVI